MELEGTIIYDLPLQEGISKAGNAWKKKEWVLETMGNYPKKVKFHVFGDRVDNLKFLVGHKYKVQFDLESREFNGRWYTDVSVYASSEIGDAAAVPPVGGLENMGRPETAPTFNDPLGNGDNSTDDLPF